MDSCFIAYMKTPDEDLPLKDNTSACLVNLYGDPDQACVSFFGLLGRRLLSENLLDACKFLVDRGRDNNGYERLNYTWVEDCVAGDRLFNNAYARYGVDAIKKTVFKRGKPLPQANAYIKIPMSLPEEADDVLEFVDTEAPFYSSHILPIAYTDPFRVRIYDEKQILNTDHLWMYLVDPFNERFHLFHAEPLYDVQQMPTYFSEHVDVMISYQHLGHVSLERANERILTGRLVDLASQDERTRQYVTDRSSYCKLLVDRDSLYQHNFPAFARSVTQAQAGPTFRQAAASTRNYSTIQARTTIPLPDYLPSEPIVDRNEGIMHRWIPEYRPPNYDAANYYVQYGGQEYATHDGGRTFTIVDDPIRGVPDLDIQQSYRDWLANVQIGGRFTWQQNETVETGDEE